MLVKVRIVSQLALVSLIFVSCKLSVLQALVSCKLHNIQLMMERTWHGLNLGRIRFNKMINNIQKNISCLEIILSCMRPVLGRSADYWSHKRICLVWSWVAGVEPNYNAGGRGWNMGPWSTTAVARRSGVNHGSQWPHCRCPKPGSESICPRYPTAEAEV